MRAIIGHCPGRRACEAAGLATPSLRGDGISELAILSGHTLHPDEHPARLPGFIESAFAPLIHTVVTRCLDKLPDTIPGDRVGVVLASMFADNATLELAERQIAAGMTMNPLFFHQTVPTSVLGQLAQERDITGPINCISARNDLCSEALAVAELMLQDAAADRVITVIAELAPTNRTRRIASAANLTLPTTNTAACLVLSLPEHASTAPRLQIRDHAGTTDFG